MPRPKKCRNICAFPENLGFSPEEPSATGKAVVLTLEEYETIRLIDREGLSQEQCAARMQVARTTVQQIYNSARGKIAEALVGGLSIHIEGGDYTLCTGQEKPCACSGCHRNSLF